MPRPSNSNCETSISAKREEKRRIRIQKRLERAAKLTPKQNLAKNEKRKGKKEKKRARRAALAMQNQQSLSLDPIEREGVRRATQGGQNQQPRIQDPAERVKREASKILKKYNNRRARIKNPITHTGVEMIGYAPHKFKSEGYVFVPAGSRYITLHCRRLTLQSGRNVWKIDNTECKGIQVPKDIYDTVIANEIATRDQRSAVVFKGDKKENEEALECLLKIFPNLPPGESEEILKRAWQKSSGRVGRTKKLTMDQKVRLAVVAHVRHRHTSYERRLREEPKKARGRRVSHNVVRRVRSEVWGEVNAVVRYWQRKVDRTTRTKVKEREIAQENKHTGPGTRRQNDDEQDFFPARPPTKCPRPHLIHREEHRRLEVITIDSSDDDDTYVDNVSAAVNFSDDEIMEGNPQDWDAAIDAQYWDIGGEEDPDSDIDECRNYPDEEESGDDEVTLRENDEITCAKSNGIAPVGKSEVPSGENGDVCFDKKDAAEDGSEKAIISAFWKENQLMLSKEKVEAFRSAVEADEGEIYNNDFGFLEQQR